MIILDVIKVKKENIFGNLMENNPLFLVLEKIGHSMVLSCISLL